MKLETVRSQIVMAAAIALLLGATVALQVAGDRLYAADRPAERLLYVRSGEALERLTLGYNVLAADIYWVRAIQHYGGDRLSDRQDRYELLYPLLDITTTLDPRFSIAYRFGAIFLAEPYPGGAGRPDQAIALLRKGMRAQPEKWQYLQDIGFVHYWYRRDFPTAAAWFRRAGELPGAPPWLEPLAAATLARGGQRSASRFLWQQLHETAEHEWLRHNAAHALRQLDALDEIDRLTAIVQTHERQHGAPPGSWATLIEAGLLRQTPIDPGGVPYELDPRTGTVNVSSESPLFPLFVEPPALTTPEG